MENFEKFLEELFQELKNKVNSETKDNKLVSKQKAIEKFKKIKNKLKNNVNLDSEEKFLFICALNELSTGLIQNNIHLDIKAVKTLEYICNLKIEELEEIL